MRIGVNNLHQIVQVINITDPSLTVYEVNRERVFGGWSDSRVLAYCYESLEDGYALYPYRNLDAIDLTEPVMDTAALNFVAMAQAGIHDDITAAEHANYFIEWQSGYTCAAKTIVREGGQLYQAMHDVDAAQALRVPSETPTLWRRVADPAEEWPAWSAPSGAHDAYDAGAKVSHKDKRWISTASGNIIEPGSPPPVDGWWAEVTT